MLAKPRVLPRVWPECPVHDHQGPRTGRHLDTCQLQTILIASVPRVRCPEHGVRIVQIPWAESYGRFTLLFERMVLSWLQDASQNARERLGLSWNEVHGMMKRAVERGLKRRQFLNLRHLGIDEKSFRRGHRYATLVNDLDAGHVLYVAEDRRETSLDGFWPLLTDEQLAAIEGVAIDMSAPFENAGRCTSLMLSTKSSTTSTMWSPTCATLWTKYAGTRTRNFASKAMIVWSGPSTTGYAIETISRRMRGRRS